MSYDISVSQVLDGFRTSASQADLALYINFLGQADSCLAQNNLSFADGRMLKIMGVRHMAVSTNDGGDVLMERAVSGASRQYSARRGGETSYLSGLRSLDKHGCVLRLLNNNARVQLRSVGPLSGSLDT